MEYLDIWGPSPIKSIDGFRYYLIFVDHFTKYIWLFPIAYKLDVFTIFPKHKAMIEKYFKMSLVTAYTDGGGEYKGLKSLLESHGVQQLLSPPHTPQHITSTE